MSDNVGLSTPRGSGTSGYVQRNLAHIRPRDSGAPYPSSTSGDDFAHSQYKQRQPDKAILEHDRKREIEVAVMELREELEEDDKLEDEEIDERCEALRKKLVREMEERSRPRPVGRDFRDRRNDRYDGGGGGRDGRESGRSDRQSGNDLRRKALKPHQVHELADAKIKESERLRQALGISKNYEEGGHWRRQEERMKKALEREKDEDANE